MNTDRSVWFGYTGTLTPVILRLIVRCVPTIVVVFLTTSVTCTYPQRSAWPAGPVTTLVVPITLFFPASADVAGGATGAAPRAAVIAFFIFVSLFYTSAPAKP